MAVFPQALDGGETTGPTTSSAAAGGVQACTASASTNTKGSYAEVVTSTAHDCDGFLVSIAGQTSNVRVLVDIAIGAAGSEDVIVDNIPWSANQNLTVSFYVPYALPAGTRIAARCQSSTGSVVASVSVALVKGGWRTPPAGATVVTWGADTADSGGTALDAGAAANTFGTIVQLSASTANDVKAIALQVAANANATPTAGSFVVRVMVGGSGSEVPVVDVGFRAAATADSYGPCPDFWFPCAIPAGSRVSARAMSTVTDATDRVFDVVVFGMEC